MGINSIGLSEEKSEKLVADLNVLLANFQIYYQNLRGIHWNIRGKSFFDLHVKFEELYNEANENVDLLAERVLTLGGAPLHTYEDYLAHTRVPIGKNVFKDEAAIRLIVDSLRELLILERGLLDASDEAGDEGTNSMISDLISAQEKTVWMMKAWLAESV